MGDKTSEDLIREAIDLVAAGYPFDGTEEIKAVWMADLQRILEDRAPVVRAEMRRIIREDFKGPR